MAELFDQAEDVVPAAGVEPYRVLLELEQDLVHLVGGEDVLDQHRGAQRAAGQVQLLLREAQHVVPESRFQVVLQLRQIEVGAEPFVQPPSPVVEHIKAEVDQAGRGRLTVDAQMLLWQVPAPRSDQQVGRTVCEPILLAVRVCEGDAALHRLDQVEMAVEVVRPGR